MGSTYFSKRIPDRTAVRRSRSRPRTFKSEDSAKLYAEKHSIKIKSLENLGSVKYPKIRIVS